ncbi:MAG: TraB/GumN family protein, partial [Sandaracinobacteroides sp.]
RNARWAAWLQKEMEKPGTLFLAVGAGHLAGNGSLIDELERRGLKAVRVAPAPPKKRRRHTKAR